MKTSILKYYCKHTLSILILLLCQITIQAQSAKISNINTQYDIYENLQRGMKISFRLDVSGMKGKKIEVDAWFYDRNGNTRTKNLGGADGYSAQNKQSVAWKTATPSYDNSYWESFSLFMPYSALLHRSGNNHYSFYIGVRKKDDSTILGESEYKDFTVNYDSPSRQLATNTYISSNAPSSSSDNNVIHTRTSLAGGGYMDQYKYPDGKMKTVTSLPCTYCRQTGVCQFCHGAGQTFVAAGMYSQYIPCNMCRTTGKCMMCGGEGVCTNIMWTDIETGAYTNSSNFNDGYVMSGYVDPTGSSNSDSYSNSSSSKSSSSRPYVEVKEYAPDYTGSRTKVWCEKCQCYDYRHAHVKKYH